MADKEVSNAFVRIGAKNADLKRAFAESETVANASLGRMGRAMQSFGQQFAGRIGIPGIAGAVGAGATVGALGVSAEATAKQMAQLGIAAGEMGIDFRKQLSIAERFSAELGKMIGFTQREGREMAILGAQFGIGGDRLEKFMRAGAGLALRRGREPIEGMRALIETTFKGRLLDDFGIFQRGPTTRDVQRAGLRRGEQAFTAFEGLGTALPGTVIDRVKADLIDTFDAVAEFAGEALGEAKDRGPTVRERARKAMEAAEESTGIFGMGVRALRERIGPTLDIMRMLNPFGEVGQFVLRHGFDRFEQSGQDVRDTIAGLRQSETGLDDDTRRARGPVSATNEFLPQGGSGGPSNFVETVDRNTAAVDRNTAEMQRAPAVRPP